MKHTKNRAFLLLMALVICVFFVAGCTPEQTPIQNSPPAQDGPATLNGVNISQYTIVYSAEEPNYNRNAADYIQAEILARTGHELAVRDDGTGSYPYEIVVGETDREISTLLDADTRNSQFAFLANDHQIAMEGDFFVIAAAAYFFVENYIPSASFTSVVEQYVTIHEPIVERADNFIFLVGDGMGLYQTLLFDVMDAPTSGEQAYSDGEDVFYGYYLSYMGLARTNSLDGLTDSAASGTALATGVKTNNGKIGLSGKSNNVTSLTELAAQLGKKTAVMSTETITGATPASFSAHAGDRSQTAVIKDSQAVLAQKYGTILKGGYDYYAKNQIRSLEKEIKNTLSKLSEGENGFFFMYEEAYIDKHCHNNDMANTLLALTRFNQAIGLFMEYAFYHPNTFVVITADHETGGMIPATTPSGGAFSYTTTNHSTQYVPVFAHGMGAEVFDGIVMENVQIPKTIAKYWGVPTFGMSNNKFAPLN